MNKKLFIVFILVILMSSGAFYGGMIYGKNKATGETNQQRQQRMQQFGASVTESFDERPGGGFVFGEIMSKDDKSITIKLRDGGSKIVFFSDTAEIDKFAEGTSADLEIGKTVMVNGKTNEDGSITAQSIQIRPEGINL